MDIRNILSSLRPALAIYVFDRQRKSIRLIISGLSSVLGILYIALLTTSPFHACRPPVARASASLNSSLFPVHRLSFSLTNSSKFHSSLASLSSESIHMYVAARNVSSPSIVVTLTSLRSYSLSLAKITTGTTPPSNASSLATSACVRFCTNVPLTDFPVRGTTPG